MQQLDAESQGTCRSGQLQSPVCGAMDSRWSFYSLAKPLLVLCEAVNVTRNTFSLAFEDLFSPTAHLRYSEISLRMRYRAVTPTALRDALPCFADSDECRNGTKLECSLCFDHGPGFQAPQSTPKPVQRQPGRIHHPQRFGYAISKCIMRSSSPTTTQTTRSCCVLQQVWCGASLTRTEYLSYRQPLRSSLSSRAAAAARSSGSLQTPGARVHFCMRCGSRPRDLTLVYLLGLPLKMPREISAGSRCWSRVRHLRRKQSACERRRRLLQRRRSCSLPELREVWIHALPSLIKLIQPRSCCACMKELVCIPGAGEFRWSLTPGESPAADISLIMLITCTLPAPTSASFQHAAPQSLQPLQQGAAIYTVGSPFGATAPDHFADLCSVGIVSQTVQVGYRSKDARAFPLSMAVEIWCSNDAVVEFVKTATLQDAGKPGLLLADFRVLPGMEGAPVFDSSNALVGILTAPFCVAGHELPVVVPLAALAPAVGAGARQAEPATPSLCRNPVPSVSSAAQPRPLPALNSRQQRQQPVVALPEMWPGSRQHDSEALRRAALGVVGCSLSNGQWASGVLINRCVQLGQLGTVHEATFRHPSGQQRI